MDSSDQHRGQDELKLGPFRIDNFEQLTENLRSAVARFQTEQSPENFAHIITSLQAFGSSGAKLWQEIADYAKLHPVRMGLAAGLLFFACKGMMDTGNKVLPKRLREGSFH